MSLGQFDATKGPELDFAYAEQICCFKRIQQFLVFSQEFVQNTIKILVLSQTPFSGMQYHCLLIASANMPLAASNSS
jgi:hypothetical protein